MTDQGKINREGARPASLFERADAAFGLDPRREGLDDVHGLDAGELKSALLAGENA